MGRTLGATPCGFESRPGAWQCLTCPCYHPQRKGRAKRLRPCALSSVIVPESCVYYCFRLLMIDFDASCQLLRVFEYIVIIRVNSC